MRNKIFTPAFIFIVSLIVIGAFSRLMPHLPNFTPIAAIALLGGATFSRKYLAIIILFAVMFLSDLLIGFHEYIIAVYFSFLLTVLIGFIVKKNINVVSVVSASVASSILFYLITNLAVWYGSPYYTQNIAGLISCYTIAIPFFRNELLGDLFFSGAFFGIYYLATKKFALLASN